MPPNPPDPKPADPPVRISRRPRTQRIERPPCGRSRTWSMAQAAMAMTRTSGLPLARVHQVPHCLPRPRSTPELPAEREEHDRRGAHERDGQGRRNDRLRSRDHERAARPTRKRRRIHRQRAIGKGTDRIHDREVTPRITESDKEVCGPSRLARWQDENHAGIARKQRKPLRSEMLLETAREPKRTQPVGQRAKRRYFMLECVRHSDVPV